MNQHGTITVKKQNQNGDTLGTGYVFNITAEEDIYNAARTVKYYSKGEIVDRITTTTAGIATKTGLPLRTLLSRRGKRCSSLLVKYRNSKSKFEI